jgi:hypothetical protein
MVDSLTSAVARVGPQVAVGVQSLGRVRVTKATRSCRVGGSYGFVFSPDLEPYASGAWL